MKKKMNPPFQDKQMGKEKWKPDGSFDTERFLLLLLLFSLKCTQNFMRASIWPHLLYSRAYFLQTE